MGPLDTIRGDDLKGGNNKEKPRQEAKEFEGNTEITRCFLLLYQKFAQIYLS